MHHVTRLGAVAPVERAPCYAQRVDLLARDADRVSGAIAQHRLGLVEREAEREDANPPFGGIHGESVGREQRAKRADPAIIGT